MVTERAWIIIALKETDCWNINKFEFVRWRFITQTNFLQLVCSVNNSYPNELFDQLAIHVFCLSMMPKSWKARHLSLTCLWAVVCRSFIGRYDPILISYRMRVSAHFPPGLLHHHCTMCLSKTLSNCSNVETNKFRMNWILMNQHSRCLVLLKPKII